MGRRTKALAAAALGGAAALLLAGAAWAHPGGGLADRADVLARALGVTAAEVEQAKEDGTLRAMLDGVTREQLAQAREDASNDAIDAALAGGSITEAQAERLRALAAPADADGLDRDAREQLRELRGAVAVDKTAVLADALGVTVAEIEQAKEDGALKTMLAEADRVALAAAFADARDAAIDAALADGSITEEQAELLRGAGYGFGGCGARGLGGWGRGHGKGGRGWGGHDGGDSSWGNWRFGGGRT